ncbi:MAG: DUF4231 domain-containing protein [Clostridiales bacterium]|nr:DUF4231 domain-containing protein [Clostridiales bacterium]
MKEKYYLLMFSLCCLGAVLCPVILVFCGSLSPLFKAALFILNAVYVLAAAVYKRKYSDFIRRRKEYERLKRKQPHYYPENSYYPVIRRSA